MRITPMAIWTSQLVNEEDKLRAISYDIDMTHPNMLVHHCIRLYCIVIHFLLDENTINDEKRAERAFELAVEKSQQDGFNFVDQKGESCNKWLKTAEKLGKVAEEHDQENFRNEDQGNLINFEIPDELIDIRN
jgi:hypothetical protein